MYLINPLQSMKCLGCVCPYLMELKGRWLGWFSVRALEIRWQLQSYFLNVLTDILNLIRIIEDVPNSMTTGLITSIYKGKKKSRLHRDNYRGITLLNVIGKILEHVILERLKPKFNELGIPNNLQYAYQKNKSCMHASFF